MAVDTSCDIKQELYNSTHCCICTETYSDPRLLPCVHTFCLKCIKGLGSGKKPGDQIACPLCRKKCEIPVNGFDDLRKNVFIEQLNNSTSDECEGCSRDVSDVTLRKRAAMLCLDCNEKLCETCIDIHKRVNITRSHSLVNLTETIVASAKVVCDKHEGDVLELFCIDCKVAICCMESHKSHHCAALHEVAEDYKRVMMDDTVKLTETIAKCRELVKDQENKKLLFIVGIDKVDREICEQADQLKQLIDQNKLRLVEDLHLVKRNRIELIDNVVEEIKQQISFLESLVEYTEELKQKGGASDIAQQSSSLHERTEELLAAQDSTQQAIDNLGFVDVTFTATNLLSQSYDPVIGYINCNKSE